MKYLYIFFLFLVFILEAQSKSKNKVQPRPKEDPEARWVCRIGSYHKCECSAMVSEVQEDAVANCIKTTITEKDYIACLNKMPRECEIIQKEDTKHPAHSCKRTCTKPRCQCADGPVCDGPEFNKNNFWN